MPDTFEVAAKKVPAGYIAMLILNIVRTVFLGRVDETVLLAALDLPMRVAVVEAVWEYLVGHPLGVPGSLWDRPVIASQLEDPDIPAVLGDLPVAKTVLASFQEVKLVVLLNELIFSNFIII